jgi:hypothetical protein
MASKDMVNILAFAANPLGDLKIDEEIRAIREEIEQANHGRGIDLRYQPATRRGDLIEYLDKHGPRVVHFSGHGSGGKSGAHGTRDLLPAEAGQASQIYLVGPDGQPVPVAQKALASLFKARRGNIRLVVLNACFTSSQAEAISQVIDCVIGTNRAIGDEAAREFSKRLYRTLADGGTVKQAFDDACVELELFQIPEESTPVLITRAGIDPAQLRLFGESTCDTSHASSGENSVPIQPVVSEIDSESGSHTNDDQKGGSANRLEAIKFTLDEDQATKAFHDWLKEVSGAPNDLASDAKLMTIKQIYVPYWSVNSMAYATYQGQRGDDYVVKGEKGEVRETKWSSAAGEVSHHFDNFVFSGSSYIDSFKSFQDAGGALRPSAGSILRPFVAQEASNIQILDSSVDHNSAVNKAHFLMNAELKRLVSLEIGGDRQKITRLESRFDGLALKRFLVPAFEGNYVYKGQNYNILINGDTGKVAGSYPVSMVKTMIPCIIFILIGALMLAWLYMSWKTR